MMPQHDNFYDVYSKAKKLKIKWPNGARMAIALAGNLEAWTEIPNRQAPAHASCRRLQSDQGRRCRLPVRLPHRE